MKRLLLLFTAITIVFGLVMTGLGIALLSDLVAAKVFRVGIVALLVVYIAIALPLLLRVQRSVSSLKCPSCGQPLAPFYGVETKGLGSTVRFCPKCGTDVQNVSTEARRAWLGGADPKADKPRDEESEN
jgi:hypothetical protein